VAELKIINLPDIGDFEEIEVIEVLIAAGDAIAPEDSIIVLESDKSTMEIPSPFGGILKSISVQVGDRISEGSEIAQIEVSESVENEKPTTVEVADNKSEANTEQAPAPAVATTETEKNIRKLSRVSLRPKPSVPSVENGIGINSRNWFTNARV